MTLWAALIGVAWASVAAKTSRIQGGVWGDVCRCFSWVAPSRANAAGGIHQHRETQFRADSAMHPNDGASMDAVGRVPDALERTHSLCSGTRVGKTL